VLYKCTLEAMYFSVPVRERRISASNVEKSERRGQDAPSKVARRS
jgi:hypothetical protein